MHLTVDFTAITVLIILGNFLENVESTGKLEISPTVLKTEVLKKIDASTINIHTIEIQSICKVHDALKDYSFPPSLKILSIKDNYLDYKDIFALLDSICSMDELYELDLSRTKFKESSFKGFMMVLDKCNGLRKLHLADNSLNKQEVACLTATLESLKTLEHLHISKCNLTERQTRGILEIKSIVSVDLSRNALEGNEIIAAICGLQSLEYLNLSHNYIKCFPLPNLKPGCNVLPANIKTIVLSSNHMTPKDVSSFCSLIRSDLLELNLDFNHVGNSIWSFCCSLRMQNLKVLSLAGADINGSAVEGLVVLLSSVRNLEELNLSSNNLIWDDFQYLFLPLSKLTQLKILNLSNNYDGVSAVLQEILPSLTYLEELRLRNVRLNGDDLIKICGLLAFLKDIRCLDLSYNAIGSLGITALTDVLKEFQLLERLDLSRLSLKRNEISALFQVLSRLTKVKYLNLSDNLIDVNALPDEFLLPPTLEELILSDIIHGEKLFVIMSRLHHLKILHLEKMNLEGRDIEALANTLFSFLLLEELVLTDLKSPELQYSRIFRAIKFLKNIRKLNLSGIRLLDEKEFGDMLSSLTLLEELVLANMNILDTAWKEIFSVIKSSKNMRKLDFSGLKLVDGRSLADVLFSLSLLEELVLAGIVVTSTEWESVFNAIALLKNLKKLDLSNIATDDEMKCLFSSLSSLLFLEEFALPNVASQAAITDPRGLINLESLRYLKCLNLRGINQNETSAKILANVLPSLNLLETLKLGRVCIDNDNQKQLFAAIGNLKYLKKLDLRDIFINTTGAETIASVLPLLQFLEALKFECGFDIDGNEIEQLFTAVRKLRYLKKLHITYRMRTGSVKFLASVLPSLQFLEAFKAKVGFDIDDSEIERLFTAVGKLKYLKKLHLACWSRTGSVKFFASALPSLQCLEALEFNVDHVSDEDEIKRLFAAVEKLKYLKKLHLVANEMTTAGIKSLATVLPSLHCLEALKLDEFYCTNDDDFKLMFCAVEKLKYVKKLYFTYQSTTRACFKTVTTMLPLLQFLEKLKLDVTPVGNITRLLAAVGKLKYLKKLDLSTNEIRATCVKTLATVLPSLQLLEVLILQDFLDGGDDDDDDNNDDDDDDDSHDDGDDAVERLFAALGVLKYLKKLDLGAEWMTTGRVKTLATVIPSLQFLEALTFQGEWYIDDDSEIERLFAAVGKLKYLKKLQLYAGCIRKLCVKNFPTVLSSLQLLEKLHLVCVDIDKQQFFAAVGKLKHLKKFTVCSCKLSDVCAETLAALLPSLPSLKTLQLQWIVFDNDESKQLLFASVRKLAYLNQILDS